MTARRTIAITGPSATRALLMDAIARAQVDAEIVEAQHLADIKQPVDTVVFFDENTPSTSEVEAVRQNEAKYRVGPKMLTAKSKSYTSLMDIDQAPFCAAALRQTALSRPLFDDRRPGHIKGLGAQIRSPRGRS